MDNLGQLSFDKLEWFSSSSPETSSSSSNLQDKEGVILASARPKKPAGRRVFRETRHPVYRGVRRRNNNKWVCEVRVPNHKSKRIWLGTYATPEMAARAHDVAALTLKGKTACLNFADSAWRLPLPASANAEEIRRVAAEAAETCAIEDDYRQQSVNAAVTDCEYCSSSNTIVGDIVDGDKPLQGVDVGEIEGVPVVEEDMHDWIRNMADMPIRSPLPCVRYGTEWNDLDLDAEVSLWSFTI